MKQIYQLVKRNVLLFFRDYSAVFFSVLSMLIVLCLMVVFLGKMNSDEIVEVLGQLGGARDAAADREHADYLVQMWTLAGILVVNSVTITLTVMGNMVHDESAGKLASFYAAPLKRYKIALGYVLSAWIVGVFMCFLTFFAGELYMVFSGQPLLTAADAAALFGMIALNAFVFAALGYLIILFVHSESGFSGLLTVIGTLVGFVGAIYLPMSMLPERVATVLKCLPVLHGASMMREVCTKDAIAQTFQGLPNEAAVSFREQMGISVIVNDQTVTLFQQIAFLSACGIIAVVLASLLSKRRSTGDR